MIKDFQIHKQQYPQYWTKVHEVIASLADIRYSGEPGASLHAVGLTQGAIDWLTDELARVVRGARQDRATWSEIGDELGTTRQAAGQRFGAIDRIESEVDGRCAAAGHLIGENSPCVGATRAVRVMNSQDTPTADDWRELGVYGCVHHATALYVRLPFPRVTSAGPEFEDAAHEVYANAQPLIRAKRAERELGAASKAAA